VSTRVAPERDVDLQGHYAGIVTRSAAFALDALTILVAFTIAGEVLEWVISALSGHQFVLRDHSIVAIGGLVVWGFFYFAYSLSVGGRTFGMSVAGLRVVRQDGRTLDTRHAVVRVLALPLSFLLFCFGLFLGLFRKDRRTLHDLIAGTDEVYAWDARGAHLRLLAMRTDAHPSVPQVGTQVLEAGVGQDHGNGLPPPRPVEQPLGGGDVGAGGEAGEDPLQTGEAPRGGDGVVVGHGEAAVDEVRVEQR
jgi:uncharacterized RDD family membrane protein YckC